MPEKIPKQNYDDLEKFYAEQSVPDAAKLARRPSSIWRRLLIAALILLGAAGVVAWLAFSVFRVFDAPRSGSVEVAIEAPTTVVIGEVVSYTVHVKNLTTEPVAGISLRANYPTGFLFSEASLTPEGSGKNIWQVSELHPSETRDIVIRGQLLGEVGSLATMYISASYQMANFRSELETSASVSSVMNAADVTLTWQGIGDTKPTEEHEYIVTYAYKGKEPLRGARLRLSWPSDFVASATTPAPTEEKGSEFALGDVSAETKGEVKVRGVWEAGSTGEQILKVALLVPLLNGGAVTIAENEQTVVLSGGDIVLRLRVNDSEEPTALDLGETMRLSLEIENTSDNLISDIEVTLRAESGLVDWSRAVVADGAEVHGSTFVWTSSKAPAVARLLPKSTTRLVADVPLKNIAPSSEGSWQVSVGAELTHHKVDDQLVDKTFTTPSLIIPVSSPLALVVEARYFDQDGTPVGTGPLPPQVGLETRYQLTWFLRGSVHRLTNVVIRAALPSEVKVIDGTVAPSFGTFELQAGQPVWKIAAVESGIEPRLSLTVGLAPRAQDVGKILILSGQTTITATDDETNGQISAAGNVATTNLDSDPAARGKGVVEAAQ